MLRKLFLLFGLSIVLFGGCRKETIFTHPDFEGSWISDDPGIVSSITIAATGDAQYREQTDLSSTYVQGKLKVGANRKFIKIGIKRFRLDQYPEYNGQRWEMKLNSVRYYKN